MHARPYACTHAHAQPYARMHGHTHGLIHARPHTRAHAHLVLSVERAPAHDVHGLLRGKVADVVG